MHLKSGRMRNLTTTGRTNKQLLHEEPVPGLTTPLAVNASKGQDILENRLYDINHT